jgi:HlyD family secretion protein
LRSSRRFRLELAAAVCLTACSPLPEQTVYQGYAEGEYLYLAAPVAGYLSQLNAERSSRVEAGAPVFFIATDPELHGVQEAEARVKAAEEKAQNLREPRRQPEIAALDAQVKAAEAALRLSEVQLQRQQALAQKGFASREGLDEAKTARARDAAQLEAARQQLSTFQIELGRKPEVRGAEADLQAAQAALAQKRWQVDKKAVIAPASGEISEHFYRPGEWIPAGQPVASLLPDSRRRIRFFVTESVVGQLRPGQTVAANCDGCTPFHATIAFIAPQAEYTPPVIYSKGMREKLVFRVDAYPPPEQAQHLRPGLPDRKSVV